jgi:hypothetical protein
MTVNSKYSEDLRKKDNQKMGSKRPLYRKKNQLLGLERDKKLVKTSEKFSKSHEREYEL